MAKLSSAAKSIKSRSTNLGRVNVPSSGYKGDTAQQAYTKKTIERGGSAFTGTEGTSASSADSSGAITKETVVSDTQVIKETTQPQKATTSNDIISNVYRKMGYDVNVNARGQVTADKGGQRITIDQGSYVIESGKPSARFNPQFIENLYQNPRQDKKQNDLMFASPKPYSTPGGMISEYKRNWFEIAEDYAKENKDKFSGMLAGSLLGGAYYIKGRAQGMVALFNPKTYTQDLPALAKGTSGIFTGDFSYWYGIGDELRTNPVRTIAESTGYSKGFGDTMGFLEVIGPKVRDVQYIDAPNDFIKPKGPIIDLKQTVNPSNEWVFRPETTLSKRAAPNFELKITDIEPPVSTIKNMGIVAAVAPAVIIGAFGMPSFNAAGKRVSPKSKAQLRKESLGREFNPLFQNDGSVGMRVNTNDLLGNNIAPDVRKAVMKAYPKSVVTADTRGTKTVELRPTRGVMQIGEKEYSKPRVGQIYQTTPEGYQKVADSIRIPEPSKSSKKPYESQIISGQLRGTRDFERFLEGKTQGSIKGFLAVEKVQKVKLPYQLPERTISPEPKQYTQLSTQLIRLETKASRAKRAKDLFGGDVLYSNQMYQNNQAPKGFRNIRIFNELRAKLRVKQLAYYQETYDIKPNIDFLNNLLNSKNQPNYFYAPAVMGKRDLAPAGSLPKDMVIINMKNDVSLNIGNKPLTNMGQSFRQNQSQRLGQSSALLPETLVNLDIGSMLVPAFSSRSRQISSTKSDIALGQDIMPDLDKVMDSDLSMPADPIKDMGDIFKPPRPPRPFKPKTPKMPEPYLPLPKEFTFDIPDIDYPKAPKARAFKVPQTNPDKKNQAFFNIDTGVDFDTAYFPSVEAVLFNVRGKRPSKNSIMTGLNLRPIAR